MIHTSDDLSKETDRRNVHCVLLVFVLDAIYQQWTLIGKSNEFSDYVVFSTAYINPTFPKYIE